MVLNIPTKRRATPEPEAASLTEDPQTNNTEPAAPPEPRRRTRRTTATTTAAVSANGIEGAAKAPAATTRTTRTRKTAAEKAAEADAQAAAEVAAEAAAEVERAAKADEPDAAAVALEAMPTPESVAPAEEPAQGDDSEGGELGRSSRRRGNRGGRGRGGRSRGERGDDHPLPAEPADGAGEIEPDDLPVARDDSGTRPELRPILRAIEQQSRQVERLARVTEDLVRRADRPPGAGGGAASTSTPVQVIRVGVFVDTANIELATDRLRVRFDWTKVLKLLLRERQLVRAVAYSPIHDDPAVSIETQRFVEPFLDRGFKIVTKPFRRFQDGSIKANLDIELALDVVAMLDRLDVLVLVSGDGDFQRLVELAQSRGVRVEVAAVGASTAGNLRHAADQYTDLGVRARELRVG